MNIANQIGKMLFHVFMDVAILPPNDRNKGII
jgi:hypothetical protein